MSIHKKAAAEMALRVMVSELESQLEKADAAYADAQWRTHFNRTNEGELNRLETVRAELLLDEDTLDLLSGWEGRVHDPLLARRVSLLRRRFRWASIESQSQIYTLRNRIDQSILAFRPAVNSTSVSRSERLQILRRDANRARRWEAWVSMGSLASEIEADVRELMCRRQKLARDQGFGGFVSWALDLMELNREWIERFVRDLRYRTDAIYQNWLETSARRLSLVDQLRPWDLAFAAEQAGALPDRSFPFERLLPAVRSVAEGVGLGDVVSGVQVNVADIPYGGLCYGVRPPGDVRIVINPNDGHAYYAILFHEFGHALHWRSLPSIPPAMRWEAAPFEEAMACLWERLAFEADWLADWDSITLEQASAHRRFWSGRMLYRLRLLMAQTVFEYQAYDNPQGDLLGLLREIYALFLGVPHDEAPGWADSPFWTSHPVYTQNYVVAEAIASQTLAALRRQFESLIGEPGIGAWLVENYYRPGASSLWTEKVRRGTGAALNSADLVTDLNLTRGETEPMD
jgi:peptidyl-dipeptidase A